MGTGAEQNKRAMPQAGNESRPGGLNSHQRAQICAIIAVGCSRSCAASYIGCKVEVIDELAARSRSFRRQLAEAESKHEIAHLENIRTAGKKEWRASAWALERRYPERYGARKQKGLTGKQVSRVLSEFATQLLEILTDNEHREQAVAQLHGLLDEISERQGVEESGSWTGVGGQRSGRQV